MKLTKDIAYILNGFLIYLQYHYNIQSPLQGIEIDNYFIKLYNEEKAILKDSASPKELLGEMFSDVTLEDAKVYFHIALSYNEQNKLKPITGKPDKIFLTDTTETFLGLGGYISIWSNENTEREYADQLRVSTLNTNRWMRIFTGIIAVSSFLTIIALGYQIYKDTNKSESQAEQDISKMRPILQGLRVDIQEINSSIERITTDTILVKRKK